MQTAAVVATDRGLNFLYLPHFESSPIFARLLDQEKGGQGPKPSVSSKNYRAS